MSFNIGLSGLRTTNQTLDVISQNIANVSTAGFKAGRAELAALYSGGQPGGVELQNVSQNFSRDGSREYTGRDLDMAISGQGFFVVKDSTGQDRYTRAGMFNKDADNFVTTADGMRLQGYGVNGNGQLNTGVLGDLQISATTMPARPSGNLEFAANLKADAPAITDPLDPADATTFNFSYSTELFDSQGNRHVLTQFFQKTTDNTWEVTPRIGDTLLPAETLTFNTDGTLATPDPATVVINQPMGGVVDDLEVTINFLGSTQYSGDFSVSRNETDGYASGDLSGIRVNEDGTLMAVYTNGRDYLQGQVVLANFANPQGLAQANGTTWTQTFASGNANIGSAGSGSLGAIVPGAYEGSNVDLTGELVNLMTSQRNYQANAKTLSTSDQLTQVLFNSF